MVSVDDQIRQTADLARQLETRNRVVAELQVQVTALQEETRALRGQLEEQDYKISQMLERQRELYRDLDQRLSDLASKASPYGQTSVTPTETATAVSEASAAPAGEHTKTKDEATKVEPVKTDVAKRGAKTSFTEEAEQAAYDGIFPLVKNKQFAEALPAYSEFLTHYVGGKNTAGARYWIGQIHYVQNNLDDAESQFKLIVAQHKDFAKAHEVLFKLGEIARKRGDNAAARSYYQKVLKQHADSASAKAAQQKLQELK